MKMVNLILIIKNFYYYRNKIIINQFVVFIYLFKIKYDPEIKWILNLDNLDSGSFLFK